MFSRRVSVFWRFVPFCGVLILGLVGFSQTRKPAHRPVAASSVVALPIASPSPRVYRLPSLSHHNPEQADCGPRALALVCQQLGVSTSLEHLRKLAGTTGEGTTLAGLAKAAAAVGLKAEGVQVNQEALSEIEMPAVAWAYGNHFIAVLAVQGSGKNTRATIHDPNAAREESISQESLLQMCGGYMLLVRK